MLLRSAAAAPLMCCKSPRRSSTDRIIRLRVQSAITQCTRRHPASNDCVQIGGGKGVRATAGNRELILGTPSYLAENSIMVTAPALDALQRSGKTVVAVAEGSNAIGLIALQDQLRPTSRRAVQMLAAIGIDTIMLTGDNIATRRAIAESAGISRYTAGMLPDQKLTGDGDEVRAARRRHGR
jgi:cation transport ATPase